MNVLIAQFNTDFCDPLHATENKLCAAATGKTGNNVIRYDLERE